MVVFIVKEGASGSSLVNSFVVDTPFSQIEVWWLPLQLLHLLLGVTISRQMILPQTVVTMTAVPQDPLPTLDVRY